jgi:hypothetical protein
MVLVRSAEVGSRDLAGRNRADKTLPLLRYSFRGSSDLFRAPDEFSRESRCIRRYPTCILMRCKDLGPGGR